MTHKLTTRWSHSTHTHTERERDTHLLFTTAMHARRRQCVGGMHQQALLLGSKAACSKLAIVPNRVNRERITDGGGRSLPASASPSVISRRVRCEFWCEFFACSSRISCTRHRNSSAEMYPLPSESYFRNCYAAGVAPGERGGEGRGSRVRRGGVRGGVVVSLKSACTSPHWPQDRQKHTQTHTHTCFCISSAENLTFQYVSSPSSNS